MAQAKPATDDAFARVMTCNVYKGAADPQAIVDAVRDQHVEVLALQETTPQFVQRLEQAGIGDYLPYAVSASSGSGYGNGLWSAQPLQQPADAEFPSSASAMPDGLRAERLAVAVERQLPVPLQHDARHGGSSVCTPRRPPRSRGTYGANHSLRCSS